MCKASLIRDIVRMGAYVTLKSLHPFQHYWDADSTNAPPISSEVQTFELSTDQKPRWSLASSVQRMHCPGFTVNISNLDVSEHRTVFHVASVWIRFTYGFFFNLNFPLAW